MTLEVRILGCGSSGGVPRLAEGAPYWGDCDPADPKNRRSRCSILVARRGAQGETRLLVDTSPDMREQLLAANVGRLDAVLITHDHADQLHGIDDLRVVTMNMRRRLDLWSDRHGLDGVMRKFGYCFESPPGSDYPPILNAREITEPFADFEIPGAGGPVPVADSASNMAASAAWAIVSGRWPIRRTWTRWTRPLSRRWRGWTAGSLTRCVARPIPATPIWRAPWNGSRG